MVLEVKVPILGFESLQSVVVKEVDTIFSTLHATNDSKISFTVVNPYRLMEDYDFEIPDSVKLSLAIDEQTNIAVYCMVISLEPKEASTVNLLAPLVVNLDKKLLAQVSLNPNKYSHYGLQEPISSFMQ
ncbi:MAG: flagellar assembly protein FliW [Thiovulaceae bacterium]|nr:flagellar assembly protein FliW [Sulfurimonadaceae bacterium]